METLEMVSVQFLSLPLEGKLFERADMVCTSPFLTVLGLIRLGQDAED